MSPTPFSTLSDRIHSRNARVGVIGLGYVGLPLAVEFARAGFTVTGFDVDASKIADCLRCDFLPECHMMPAEIRDRRRALRYRHLLVRQMVQMKNRVSGLLMETGGRTATARN